VLVRIQCFGLARESRRWDEALPEGEAEASSLSWFNGKELWHGAVMW
jgi:hypothetical protein